MNQKLVIWGTVPEKQSETDRIFCHFGPCFALLPHYWPQTLKFGKNVKKPSKYYPFKHVYHKWRSYHVWFLRYKGMRENVFCHFGPSFAPSDPPNNPKNQNFEKKETNTWRYHNFTQVYHKWQSYDVWFLIYEARQTEFFLILSHFLPFLPH